MGWERNGHLWQCPSHTAGAAGYPLTRSHFLSPGKSQSEKISLGPELCCLGEGTVQEKSAICPNVYLFTYYYFSIFLLQWCARTSPLETWTSTKAFLSMSNCLRQCFSVAPGPHLRGAELCTYYQCTGGWHSSRVLRLWRLTLALSHNTLVWMDAKLVLCWGVPIKGRLTQLCYWHNLQFLETGSKSSC